MPYNLFIQSEAIEDMRGAFEWYEEQQKGLGHLFLGEIDKCLTKIKEHPFQCGLVNEWVRKIKPDRFPFLIVFEVEGDTIYIVAVRHTSRRPKY